MGGLDMSSVRRFSKVSRDGISHDICIYKYIVSGAKLTFPSSDRVEGSFAYGRRHRYDPESPKQKRKRSEHSQRLPPTRTRDPRMRPDSREHRGPYSLPEFNRRLPYHSFTYRRRRSRSLTVDHVSSIDLIWLSRHDMKWASSSSWKNLEIIILFFKLNLDMEIYQNIFLKKNQVQYVFRISKS